MSRNYKLTSSIFNSTTPMASISFVSPLLSEILCTHRKFLDTESFLRAKDFKFSVLARYSAAIRIKNNWIGYSSNKPRDAIAQQRELNALQAHITRRTAETMDQRDGRGWKRQPTDGAGLCEQARAGDQRKPRSATGEHAPRQGRYSVQPLRPPKY